MLSFLNHFLALPLCSSYLNNTFVKTYKTRSHFLFDNMRVWIKSFIMFDLN